MKKEKNTNLNIFLHGSKSETSFCVSLDKMRMGCQYQLNYMVNSDAIVCFLSQSQMSILSLRESVETQTSHQII